MKAKEEKAKGVYAAAKEQAEQNKTAQKVSVEYIEFKKDGVSVLGRFIGTNQIESRLNEGKYFQYLFETDAGPVKFACGGQFDSEAGRLMKINAVYEITFKGKESIPGGHRVNKFDVVHYPQPGEVDPDEDDFNDKPIIE